ncbi:MAG: hypothetical protein HPY85_17600 [Anaerolineae bacterium]|nr:hypothetical protein [Anaerolineae bacterium]
MKPNRRIKRITGVLLVLTAAGFAAAAALEPLWGFVIAAAVFGAMRLALLIADQHFGDRLLFLLFTLFSVLGVVEGLPLALMAGLLCLNLAVWNLSEFIGDLLRFDAVFDQRRMENLRLRRLALVLGGAYLLTLLPILVEIQLGFVAIAVAALLAVYLLGAALMRLRNKGE